jgi:hypothetical protein
MEQHLDAPRVVLRGVGTVVWDDADVFNRLERLWTDPPANLTPEQVAAEIDFLNNLLEAPPDGS